MSVVTDELRAWKDELEAVASGLVGTLDLAMRNGVDRGHLDEIQDVIDNTNSACLDLGGAIRGIELTLEPPQQ